MAYKIRYGFDRFRQNSVKRMIRLQILGAAALTRVSGLARLQGGGVLLLRRWFCMPPASVAEQAVAAFADALSHGAGWYYGLAVWCRTIIDGGSV